MGVPLTTGKTAIDDYWQADKYVDFIDLSPIKDIKGHLLGDECWCQPTVLKPGCGGCGDKHVAIVSHNATDGRPTTARDECRDDLSNIISSFNPE